MIPRLNMPLSQHWTRRPVSWIAGYCFLAAVLLLGFATLTPMTVDAACREVGMHKFVVVP
jgi:hypothetical protein